MAIDPSNTQEVVEEASDTELNEFYETTGTSDARRLLAYRLIDRQEPDLEDNESLPTVSESIDAINSYLNDNYAAAVGLATEFQNELTDAGLDTSKFTVTNDRFRASVTVNSTDDPLTRDAMKELRENGLALVEAQADGTLYFTDINVLTPAVDVGVSVNE